MKKEGKIVITKNGPYAVSGNIPLDKQEINTDNKGYPIEYRKIKDYPKKEIYYLCRCGHSSNKPFCDSSHIRIKFDGRENAGTNKYLERTETVNGPTLTLTDDISLCSGAGFCHGKEGEAWNLIKSKDEKLNQLGIQQCFNCPSGRLVVWNKKTKKPLEPDFKPHISILYEPWKKVGSSIWVKGNIPIKSSEGKTYETRNRVTLCRCGRSANMPFCDSTHRSENFKDD